MAKIAFLGLGTMGYYMAAHLQQDHDVNVYNRTQEKADRWCEIYSGTSHASPREAAADCDYVFMCVGNDDDVRSVVFGESGALVGMKPGACLVDHTTASPALARELYAACREVDMGFMDAPVSGGAEGAQHARLTVMCGADDGVFTRLEPIIDCYAAKCTLIGAAGAGQAAKMVNQICVGGVLQSLAEALHLAKSLNLDVEQVIAAISQGAAGSWQMDNRWKTMIDGDYSPKFSVNWMAKDLAICLGEAHSAGVSLPVTEQINQFYAELQASGDGELDITSLMKRLEA